jgi:hypothetical protein
MFCEVTKIKDNNNIRFPKKVLKREIKKLGITYNIIQNTISTLNNPINIVLLS